MQRKSTTSNHCLETYTEISNWYYDLHLYHTCCLEPERDRVEQDSTAMNNTQPLITDSEHNDSDSVPDDLSDNNSNSDDTSESDSDDDSTIKSKNHAINVLSQQLKSVMEDSDEYNVGMLVALLSQIQTAHNVSDTEIARFIGVIWCFVQPENGILTWKSLQRCVKKLNKNKPIRFNVCSKYCSVWKSTDRYRKCPLCGSIFSDNLFWIIPPQKSFQAFLRTVTWDEVKLRRRHREEIDIYKSISDGDRYHYKTKYLLLNDYDQPFILTDGISHSMGLKTDHGHLGLGF